MPGGAASAPEPPRSGRRAGSAGRIVPHRCRNFESCVRRRWRRRRQVRRAQVCLCPTQRRVGHALAHEARRRARGGQDRPADARARAGGRQEGRREAGARGAQGPRGHGRRARQVTRRARQGGRERDDAIRARDMDVHALKDNNSDRRCELATTKAVLKLEAGRTGRRRSQGGGADPGASALPRVRYRRIRRYEVRSPPSCRRALTAWELLCTH